MKTTYTERFGDCYFAAYFQDGKPKRRRISRKDYYEMRTLVALMVTKLNGREACFQSGDDYVFEQVSELTFTKLHRDNFYRYTGMVTSDVGWWRYYNGSVKKLAAVGDENGVTDLDETDAALRLESEGWLLDKNDLRWLRSQLDQEQAYNDFIAETDTADPREEALTAAERNR
jgi:hypothetical protein